MRFPFLLVVAVVPTAVPVRAVAQAPRTTVEFRASADALSGGNQAWQEHTVAVRHRASARTGLGVTAGWLERFGAPDQRVMVDASMAAGSRLTLGVEGEMSPTHEVVARTGGALRAHVSLGAGFGIEGRVAERRFTATQVQGASVQLERYWSSWHLAWIGGATRLEAAPTAMSHAVRLSRYWEARGALTVGVSAGEEVEAPAPGRLLVMDVRSVGAWGALPIGRNVDLTFAAGVTDQGTLFTRRHGALGLRIGR